MVEYLHNLNHRRLAFVGHHVALGPIGEREKAFVETVSRYTLGTEWRTVATQDALDGGQQAAYQILSSGFQPTAIICVNDIMAGGVLREVREQGLRVPQDISVTGFRATGLAARQLACSCRNRRTANRLDAKSSATPNSWGATPLVRRMSGGARTHACRVPAPGDASPYGATIKPYLDAQHQNSRHHGTRQRSPGRHPATVAGRRGCVPPQRIA